MTRRSDRVFVFGAGKVGSGLSRALRAAGFHVTLRAARRGLPKRPIDADVIVIAVRDRDIPIVARELAEKRLIGHRKIALLHCAGALGPEVLEAARGANVAVAQMHPMISFASTAWSPSLARGQLHVDGDAHAVKRATRIGRALGMTPRTIARLDRTLYHAAAGLVANGAAALTAGGVEMLVRAGVDAKTAASMLGPLLRSVSENVERLGLPAALTGPVRRGDANGVVKHLAVLDAKAPDLAPLYVAASRVQLPLARALAEAPADAFDAIEVKLKQRG